ncbi:MAG: hypothetical protein A3H97_12840 [Acidobacteria bacterium RIFCSPLOWO2_02_FULL_65_29]|nr:MAG: hypothetical protein A3H97_12840 [Acidobacteria bacterium RIFCSPLOWO2_02_FULL_65_29]
MNTETGGPTLLRPEDAHRASASPPGSPGLPRDLLARPAAIELIRPQAARRSSDRKPRAGSSARRK